MGWKTWRRPTLPRLETQYHGRWGFSRPSSGWDRVVSPRHGHQVVQPALGWGWLGDWLWCVVVGDWLRVGAGNGCCAGWLSVAVGRCAVCFRADRAIRTGSLR